MTEPSGAALVARIPTSVSVDDLAPAFAAKVESFIAAIKNGGGEVGVTRVLFQGSEIDMQIVVFPGSNIRDAKGESHSFAGPVGGSDPRVVEIGETYGVANVNGTSTWTAA